MPNITEKEIVMIDIFSKNDKSKAALPQQNIAKKNTASDTSKHYKSNEVVKIFK